MTNMRHSFDALVSRLADSPMTLSERELLEPTHWSLGENARCREDFRFRKTPWGQWMFAEDFLANDAIYRWLHAERRSSIPLQAALTRAADLVGRRCVFCAEDPRFVLRHLEIHLAANELTREPVVEDEIGELEKYATHLPLHSLKAAAASEPAGEWGPRAQEQTIETLGWVRVTLSGRRLNDRMFIAQVEGHSMDDGKSGLVDGGFAVFELWPSGTKQLLNVLVCGAFRDPETGSYAVKKYVADQRDADGRHHKVSLVSLNPDKDLFPDIELEPEDDDEITVVAKVVQSLSADDYERRPKPKRRIGHRNLTGQEGLDEQKERLGRKIASFFDRAVPDDEDEDERLISGWQTRLVCLEVAAGGLHLEAGPLEGLPPFVKKLRVVSDSEWDFFVLAANARLRPVRVNVPPETGSWTWEAVGFEDELDLGVDRLNINAIKQNTVVVFRVDAEGVGRLQNSTTLSHGQAYRMLLPPGIGDLSLGVELETGAGGGWRFWSLDLEASVSVINRQVLTSLGLELGEAWPRIEWALTPATAWRTNARGESYPVFEGRTEVFVNVSGLSIDEGDTAMLFLHGPTGTEQLSLSTNGLFSLGKPVTGRWACALMHSRTNVRATTLVFEIAKNAVHHVAVTHSATAPTGLVSLEITAPPGWPVVLRWCVLHEEPFTTKYAGDDGKIELDDAATLIKARATRTRIADLVVDFGELGRHSFVYDKRATVEQVCETLAALWQQRADLVQSRAGAWMTLLPAWFEPVTSLFGYGLEPLIDSAISITEADAPYGLAVWQLTVDERMSGGITRSTSRVLVLTTDLDAVLSTERVWIDRVCDAAQVRDAVVTDGVRWTTHRRGGRLSRTIWHIGDSILEQQNVEWMLADLGEGL